MDTTSAKALREAIIAGQDIAVLDPREEGAYSVEPHLFQSVNLPLSQLELRVSRLLPRKQVRIVVVSMAGDGLDARMAARLAELGYENVAVLQGGVQAWQADGLPAFTGFNTPSKAFGEFVEHACGTPSISADELAAWEAEGRDMVIVDSRTPEEHHRGTIPGSISAPGAELVLRAGELAPDPDTVIVVNCAGRTRSIIGAQSLINAGVPNRVVALRNGTMGWKLAGYDIETGSTRRAPNPAQPALQHARARATAVAARCGVPSTGWKSVQAWMHPDAERTCYLYDVRMREEHLASHPQGARHAAGGQLVQATDTYVAVRSARIVLYDHLNVRSAMTASWLMQMGFPNVCVLDGEDGDIHMATGATPDPVPGMPAGDIPGIAPAALAALGTQAHIVDLGPGKDYVSGHVPGAWWTVRSRLGLCLRHLPAQGTLVLVSPDARLARLAWPEARALHAGPVLVLEGGSAGWKRAGLPLEAGETRLAGPLDDAFVKPFEAKNREKAMQDYLDWEVNLVESVRRDPTVSFRPTLASG
jgi:rhodanese-related sulfurtransferase